MNVFGAIFGLLFPGGPSVGPVEDPRSAWSLFVVRPVPGRPFSADVIIWKRDPDGREETVTENVYVDGRGRMRYEHQQLHEPVATVSDPVSGEYAMIGLTAGKLLIRTPFPSQTAMAAPSGTPAATERAAGLGTAATETEDLGVRTFEGFECRGHRMRRSDGDDEVWTVVGHQLVAHLRRTDASGHEFLVVRLANVKMGEPPPELFQLPARIP